MDSQPEPATCSVCGATATPAPMGWTREIDPRRGPRWVCAACTRRYARSIEARLDQQWW